MEVALGETKTLILQVCHSKEIPGKKTTLNRVIFVFFRTMRLKSTLHHTITKEVYLNIRQRHISINLHLKQSTIENTIFHAFKIIL